MGTRIYVRHYDGGSCEGGQVNFATLDESYALTHFDDECRDSFGETLTIYEDAKWISSWHREGGKWVNWHDEEYGTLIITENDSQ